jgi:hypothetical protein
VNLNHPAESKDNLESKYIGNRLLFGLFGTAFLILGLIGKTPGGLRAPLWMRVTHIALGLFGLYAALISLPRRRKMGLKLEKELDEAEREMDLRK